MIQRKLIFLEALTDPLFIPRCVSYYPVLSFYFNISPTQIESPIIFI